MTSRSKLLRLPMLAALAVAVALAVTALGAFGTSRTTSASHGRPHLTLEINGERDITINGINPGDGAGFVVATGDVNNDGAEDLIVGAPFAVPGGRPASGETYVLFGPLEAGTFELSTDPDITITGVDTGDESGIVVATGDLNNDGVDDLIVGARRGDPGGRIDAGETYVFFGPLRVGSPSSATEADITIHGIDPGDLSGVGVAAGDVNHDGVHDLIIGASGADPGGRSGGGETYVLFGPLVTGTLELSTDTDITINGIDSGDSSGGRVATGDINNDGTLDLIIAAHGADLALRTNAGETYIVFGPLGAGAFELSSIVDITINGIAPGDISGRGVAAGDINNDGADDLIVGAYGADPGVKTDAGETYLLLGPVGAGTYELSAIADITFDGIDPCDRAGAGLATGDVDNDGLVDLVIGAWGSDPDGRLGAGEVYVIFGEPAPPRCNGLLATIMGTTAADMLVGTPGDDVIVRLGGDDVILGRGGDDTICAGIGCDVVDGGEGNDWIAGGGGADSINGGSGQDILFGGAGNDFIGAGRGNDQAAGGAGNDIVFGHGGNDELLGGEGDDMLFGKGGDDAIGCGEGTDIANGGPDTDTAGPDCELQASIP